MNQLAIGIDIGGTNTFIGIMDEDGKILTKVHLTTTDFKDLNVFIDTIKFKVDQELKNIQNYHIAGVGIGAPNGNYYNGKIEDAPNIPWKGNIPLKELFEERFQNTQVFVTNDANAAALGEKIYGRAKNISHFVVVTLGTGVGSGFVSNDRIIYGHDGFAGELGHTIIEHNGRKCGCGRRGCLETYASATGFLRTTREFLRQSQENSFLRTIPESELSGKDVSNAANKGDSLALQIFDYTAQKLAFSLANMVAITSPEEIILFGGLANAGDLLLVPTRKYLEDYLLNIFKGKIKLTKSELNNNHAAILGAGALVWQERKKQMI